jgi:EmrB/QacA subfamily drug resistance transporter
MSGSTTAEAVPAPAGNPPKYWLLLLTVSLSSILAPLNSTMLAVALPELRDDFNVSHAEIAWLVSAYLIVMAVAQPLGGRVGDQLGRAPVLRAGLVAFLALSVACALAPTFPTLMLFRSGQALVGAAAIPNGMAMLRESLPTDRLGRSVGLTGAAISIAAAFGPLLGAALLGLGSWRYLFLVNIPLVSAGLVCLTILQYQSRGERTKLSIDWPGAVAFAVLLVSVTILLTSLRGNESTLVLSGAIVALVVFGLVFLHRQLNSETPIADWRLFRIRSYAASTMFILLGNLVMYTTILAIPFFLDEVQGRGSGARGILLACVALPMTIIGPIAGRISDSAGRRPLVNAGSGLIIVAMAVLTVGISADSSPEFLAACLLCLGFGMSISFGGASAAAVESTPVEVAGAAAGTNSMMRYLGSIIGVGVLGAVLNIESDSPGIGVFQLVFAVLLVVAVLALISSLFIHRFPAERRRAPSAIPAVPAEQVGVPGS